MHLAQRDVKLTVRKYMWLCIIVVMSTKILFGAAGREQYELTNGMYAHPMCRHQSLLAFSHNDGLILKVVYPGVGGKPCWLRIKVGLTLQRRVLCVSTAAGEAHPVLEEYWILVMKAIRRDLCSGFILMG